MFVGKLPHAIVPDLRHRILKANRVNGHHILPGKRRPLRAWHDFAHGSKQKRAIDMLVAPFPLKEAKRLSN